MSGRPIRLLPRALFAGLLLLSCDRSGCGEKSFDAIVYGKDDRFEVSTVDADARGAAGSVALLASAKREMVCRAGSCAFFTAPVSESLHRRLCDDEPFRDQPTLGSCSGFLVGPDLLATAGHCVRTAAECADTVAIFDFEMPAAADRPYVLPSSEVYFCAQVLSARDRGRDDFSVMRLDRPVRGHMPLCVRREGRPKLGTKVMLIGHPFSLPKKVAGGAQVKRLDRKYFESNIDSIGGSSGSPVFDARTFVVEGVFVRGWDGNGWNNDARGECAGSRWCSDTAGCDDDGFEDVTFASVFVAAVPRVPCYVPGFAEPREQRVQDDEGQYATMADEREPASFDAPPEAEEEGVFDVKGSDDADPGEKDGETDTDGGLDGGLDGGPDGGLSGGEGKPATPEEPAQAN